MNLYFAEHVDTDIAVLSESESRHCIKSMRMHKGDRIQLGDGKGNLFTGVIIGDDPKSCTIALQEKKEMPEPFPYRLHLAVAATKNQDRIEWFVEKAVEIGVTEISIIHCKHSEKTNIKTDRIERLMIAAMKQSLHFWLPTLHPNVDLQELIQQYTPLDGWQKLIAYCGEGTEKKELLSIAVPQKDSLVLIGPEGDFAPEEVSAACNGGFVPVSLGDMRLRTETAALFACCQIHFINFKKNK